MQEVNCFMGHVYSQVMKYTFNPKDTKMRNPLIDLKYKYHKYDHNIEL